MQIRRAIPADIPAIVKVLKASLGEADLTISEKVWNFKHVINPFGKSIVLIATEEEEVIGVRAFMRWQWQKDKRIYSCFRAVDTATHPEHQGKGIFKRLTLNAIKLAQAEGADFIFNTPNEKSRPGYLKMNWEIAGKIKVALKPAFKSFWNLSAAHPSYDVTYTTSCNNVEELCAKWNSGFNNSNLYTPKSVRYLKWRYEENPLQGYEVFATSDFYLAGHVKRRNRIKELRIVECIKITKNADVELEKCMNTWAAKFGVQFISFSPRVTAFKKFFMVEGPFGPLTTVRNLNLNKKEKENCFEIDNWIYSLGDLELF